MAKLKVVIGNIDIETDDPKAASAAIRGLVNGLLNIELGERRRRGRGASHGDRKGLAMSDYQLDAARASSAPPDGWMPLPGTEPPHGDVLQVVIGKHVQHMPAIWDGTEWTWLDARDEDDPIPPNKITHWRKLPSPPAGQGGKL